MVVFPRLWKHHETQNSEVKMVNFRWFCQKFQEKLIGEPYEKRALQKQQLRKGGQGPFLLDLKLMVGRLILIFFQPLLQAP